MKNLILLTTFLLVAAPSFAGGKKDGHHQMGEKMRKELGLTDEQLAQMKEIRSQRKVDIKAKQAQVKEAREAFRQALANPKSSTEELKAKYQTMSAARQASRDARFETMLEVRAILKEDQISKFQELRGKWKGKHKGQRKG